MGKMGRARWKLDRSYTEAARLGQAPLSPDHTVGVPAASDGEAPKQHLEGTGVVVHTSVINRMQNMSGTGHTIYPTAWSVRPLPRKITPTVSAPPPPARPPHLHGQCDSLPRKDQARAVTQHELRGHVVRLVVLGAPAGERGTGGDEAVCGIVKVWRQRADSAQRTSERERSVPSS